MSLRTQSERNAITVGSRAHSNFDIIPFALCPFFSQGIDLQGRLFLLLIVSGEGWATGGWGLEGGRGEVGEDIG